MPLPRQPRGAAGAAGLLGALGLLAARLGAPTGEAFVPAAPRAELSPQPARSATALRAELSTTAGAALAYPEDAYGIPAYTETPAESWFQRNKIDKHKVNMVMFGMFAKPKEFFPRDLKPGDTIRVYYLEAEPTGEGRQRVLKVEKKQFREVTFDGVLLNIRGEYHARTMTVRAMVGKGMDVMGVELNFPMHSPLVTKIEVLRRGYIGRNKNAYFMRGMIGKKNVIPVDQERTKRDAEWKRLIEEGKGHLVPEPEYPQQEWDRYPLPVWKQDQPDWDESKYKPEDVDQRSDYEIRVIGRYKERPSRSGKYGGR